MQQRIRLETDEAFLVASFEIPEFRLPPKVVTWGNRIFCFHRWTGEIGTPERTVLYREVFAYSITHEPIDGRINSARCRHEKIPPGAECMTCGYMLPGGAA